MKLANLEFYIVVPQASVNLVKNPNPYYRISDYGSNNGAISLNSEHTRRGPQCIRVVPVSGVDSRVYHGGLPVTSGLAYTFSVDVLGVAGQTMRIYIANSSGTAKATQEFIATGNWQRKEVTWIADETSANYWVYVARDSVASTDPFWVDGFQFEEGAKATTFMQGWRSGLGYMNNTPEYGWQGHPGNSPSWRSAWTRHGGRLLRIKDYAKIIDTIGLGQGPYNQISTPIVTGGDIYQKHFREPRDWGLTLVYHGDSLDEMMKNRAVLLDAIRPDKTPYDQPLVVMVQGYDEDGNEVTDPVDIVSIPLISHTNLPKTPVYQRDVLMFRALDGHLQGAFKNGSTLNYKVEFQGDYLLKQDHNGCWVDLAENNYMAGVVGGDASVIKEAPNGDIYVGGKFTSVKNGETAVPNTGSIARYSKASQMWEAVGNANLINHVSCMEFDASGNLYVGGGFQNLAGIANADYFAKYNPATNTWSALGSGINGRVDSIAISPDGVIYIGGNFTSASGNSNCKGVARWGGSTWQPLASGLNDYVHALKFHPNGNLLIGGSFTNADGTKGTNICFWRTGAFYAYEDWGGTPINNLVYSIDTTPDGTIVIGGAFTNAGDDPNADYVAQWNGTNWQSVGGAGADSVVHEVYCTRDGAIYAAGEFTKIGDLSTIGKVAFYKNGAWQVLDISMPVGSSVYSVFLAADNSLYVGGYFTGIISAPNPKELEYKTTANSGSANTYPLIEIVGPGWLEAITNHTTGRTIRFNNLELAEGERIWIDFNPVKLKMWSSWEGRGSVWRYLNAGSDIGDWYMQPGKNSIGVFISRGFDMNNTRVYVQWFPKYWGLEGTVLE